MEILFELVFAVLQFVAEIILQIVFEALAELGLHSVREVFRRPAPLHPLLAIFGYAILGAIAGGISLWLFPVHFIGAMWLRVANLAVTPVLAGAAMAALGSWRKGKGEEPVLLDRFAYGFLFAFVMAAVRFFWAQHAA